MTIIQEETTGCGIAAVANIVKLPYAIVKAKAHSIGIKAEDESLYSDTKSVRRLLKAYAIKTSRNEVPFHSWESLPDMALLSIKYDEENGCAFWHWVVFIRDAGTPVVLDSAADLENNERTDFNNMAPKWFIEVSKT